MSEEAFRYRGHDISLRSSGGRWRVIIRASGFLSEFHGDTRREAIAAAHRSIDERLDEPEDA